MRTLSHICEGTPILAAAGGHNSRGLPLYNILIVANTTHQANTDGILGLNSNKTKLYDTCICALATLSGFMFGSELRL